MAEDIEPVVTLLVRIKISDLKSADLQILLKFHEATYNWEQVAALEIEQRQEVAKRGCTRE